LLLWLRALFALWLLFAHEEVFFFSFLSVTFDSYLSSPPSLLRGCLFFSPYLGISVSPPPPPPGFSFPFLAPHRDGKRARSPSAHHSPLASPFVLPRLAPFFFFFFFLTRARPFFPCFQAVLPKDPPLPAPIRSSPQRRGSSFLIRRLFFFPPMLPPALACGREDVFASRKRPF